MYHDELLVTIELNVKVPPIVDADFEFLQNDFRYDSIDSRDI